MFMINEIYYQFMKNFFESYYQKLALIDNGIALLRPMNEADKSMWSDNADPKEEWKIWKLIPSIVTNSDIEHLEQKIGSKFPACLKAFLSVYHHYFDAPVGCNPVSSPFEAILGAWNPVIIKYGYLPFTWDSDGYYIRCINLKNMPNEEKCGIYQIDHEVLFSMTEDTIQKKEIDENMKYISQNLFTYLNSILSETI